MEFAEGVVTGVRTLFGSAIGGAAGAFSKITGVLGKGLATLTLDDEYKISRIRRKEPATHATTDIAMGGKNVVMVCIQGFCLITFFFSFFFRVLLMVSQVW